MPLFFVVRRLSVRLWGKRDRRHNNNSRQRQSQPNIFAVTIIVVAFGHSLYLVCFPPASYLVSRASSNPTDQAPNPSKVNYDSTGILLGVVFLCQAHVAQNLKKAIPKLRSGHVERKEIAIQKMIISFWLDLRHFFYCRLYCSCRWFYEYLLRLRGIDFPYYLDVEYLQGSFHLLPLNLPTTSTEVN